MAYVFNVIASVGRQNDVNAAITLKKMPGAIARSVAMSLGNQEAPRSFLWHIFSLRFSHENISTTILPLPPIQEEHLSVNGEMVCAKSW